MDKAELYIYDIQFHQQRSVDMWGNIYNIQYSAIWILILNKGHMGMDIDIIYSITVTVGCGFPLPQVHWGRPAMLGLVNSGSGWGFHAGG